MPQSDARTLHRHLGIVVNGSSSDPDGSLDSPSSETQ